MDNTKTINILSLCAGYFGLELGLSRALEGVFRVVAVEVEAYALANLAAKAQEGKLAIEAMWPDLKTFPAERFRGCFDFVLAGYPCQPFSIAGKRQGTDDPRHLWPHIERIVQAVRPVWCFFENVPGHLTIGFGEVYRSLRTLGYSVEAGIFSAAEVGAPHKRQRLFILAKSNRSRNTQPRLQPAAISAKSSQLADTKKFTERKQGDETSTFARENTRKGFSRGGIGMWPSHPGQPQYEWEEPRVLSHAVCAKRRQAKKGSNEAAGGQEFGTERTIKGQAQSRLGRAVNGASSRVDRLRLLGNGVVPQQAERAFRHLVELF